MSGYVRSDQRQVSVKWYEAAAKLMFVQGRLIEVGRDMMLTVDYRKGVTHDGL